MPKYNVVADNWTNGKYCYGHHLDTREQAQYGAECYKAKYEGQPYPNGKGYYMCKNFRVVEIPDNEPNELDWLPGRGK